jgi:hypothetical protein
MKIDTANTDLFYASLPVVDNFDDLTNSSNYWPLPNEWCLAVADVVNSTGAIAAGEYKAVNTVGVSVIAAITNALKPLDLPYVFGGDGALVCLPLTASAKAGTALAATAAMAQQSFALELRTALVPASYLRQHDQQILIARQRVSPHYDQCALFGGGAHFAEEQLKSGKLPAEFLVSPDPNAEADFSGLECRWNEVQSPEEETVAVIVRANVPLERTLGVYQRTLKKITEIYGDVNTCRPITKDRLNVTLSSFILRHEARVKTWGQDVGKKIRYTITQRMQVLLGWFFFLTGMRIGGTEWNRYKEDLVWNTDFRKFDGYLRLVLAGNKTKRKALEEYLNGLKRSGEVSYGMHVSTSAIMTCLVRQRQYSHVHFVDASGGGYAAAARAMKENA